MKNYSNLLLTIGAGAALGAVAALLYSPGKGSQTRKRLLKSATGLTGQLKDLVWGAEKKPVRASHVRVRSNGHARSKQTAY